ncbi:hypothetical protein SLEP1_g52204 [Rubroshorea leprosula]|uniref:Uncharacterized protein n=1 Tax=Rubroshorea leprosula TaxID=152421 RepID=A0AAV5M5I7_9ROSI|nr:hypothetical protein SLEP1_g52204 [Rubroshorea leprosula]
MIVPPKLQDLPETITPKSSACSSVGGNSGDHHSSTFKDSSLERMLSDARDAGEGANSPPVTNVEADVVVFEEWENRTINGRLDNICHTYMNYPTLVLDDVDLKNKLLDYVKDEGLVDVEALVTPKQLVVFGFVDVTNLYTEAYWRGKVNELNAREVAVGRAAHKVRLSLTNSHLLCRPIACHRGNEARARCPGLISSKELKLPSDSQRRVRDDSDAKDDVPLLRWRTSTGSQPVQPVVVRSSNVLPTSTRDAVEAGSIVTAISGPRIAYPKGFSYTKMDYQATMLQGMHNFVPLVDHQHAKDYMQQRGGHDAMLKLMDTHDLNESCKRLTSEKASLEDEVNHLQSSEMANTAASVESRVDELGNQDEAGCVEDRAKNAEAYRDKALDKLNSLKQRVAEANQNLIRAKAALNKMKKSHQCPISITRAQRAEWLIGSDMFQDAVAVASPNTTSEIYNEIRGKVLRHRPDFPIGELAFYEGEEVDEQGKSRTPLTNNMVRLRWELNEDGVPVWPSSVVEEGEDLEGFTTV